MFVDIGYITLTVMLILTQINQDP